MTLSGQGSPVLGSPIPGTSEPSSILEPEVAGFYEKSNAKEYGFNPEDFAGILADVARKSLSTNNHSDTRTFLEALRLDELALARGCAAGNERAWEVFMGRYREKLYDIAGYIAKESSAARELADSLYSDLYGTTIRDGKRISKLSSYTGRGSLEGWLRTVMAQEYVNRYRRQRRLVSLDEESEEGRQFAAAESEGFPTIDPKIEAALDEAMGMLSAGDRFVLAAYYIDQRTLAQIAGVLSVHESTISRKLDKLVKSIRKQILAGLMARGMRRRQAQECLDVDVRDLRLNIGASLAQESSGTTFPEKTARTRTK
ncbi:MAG: sigma-70 family RNA polymerase sigma factor [Acidobacteriaceae bacterium]